MMGKNLYQEAVTSLSPGGLEYRPPLAATLRDQFAMAAVGPMAQFSVNKDGVFCIEAVAERSYELADAMLKARQEGKA